MDIVNHVTCERSLAIWCSATQPNSVVDFGILWVPTIVDGIDTYVWLLYAMDMPWDSLQLEEITSVILSKEFKAHQHNLIDCTNMLYNDGHESGSLNGTFV